MKNRRQVLFLILIGFSCVSCNSLKLINYYYPIEEQTSIKVYVYVNPNNHELNEYWKVSSNSSNSSLLTESYDANFRLYNRFKEQQTNNGYNLIEYTEFEYQGTYADQEIASQIIESNVYKFDKEQPYRYSVKYKNKYGNFVFTKERKFEILETITVLNEKYKVAKFADKYFIEAKDLNESYEFEQNTYYAKGIGMVKYERTIPNEGRRILELKDIITESEFINMINKSSR